MTMHASRSGRHVMRVIRVIFAPLPPCFWKRYPLYRRSARSVCCPHSAVTPQKKMMAVGTDFDSPVARPTPGSTESTTSCPDANEAVGRKASQPHPVAPAWGSPMPAPLTQQHPHWWQRGGGASWPVPWTGHERPHSAVSCLLHHQRSHPTLMAGRGRENINRYTFCLEKECDPPLSALPALCVLCFVCLPHASESCWLCCTCFPRHVRSG